MHKRPCTRVCRHNFRNVLGRFACGPRQRQRQDGRVCRDFASTGAMQSKTTCSLVGRKKSGGFGVKGSFTSCKHTRRA